MALTSFVAMPLSELLEQLAAKTPTPGGGTAAACAGAMGAALVRMAIEFTRHRKSTSPELAGVLDTVTSSLVDLQGRLARLADEDSAAYEALRAARKLPQETGEQRAARESALGTATAAAAAVPLRTARLCRDGLEMASGLAGRLNPNLVTDLASGALLLETGCLAACWNVEVNLADLDAGQGKTLRTEIEKLRARVAALEEGILSRAADVLRGGDPGGAPP